MFKLSPGGSRTIRAMLSAMGLGALQWLGDALVELYEWPLPGSLVGMLVLFGVLMVLGRVPRAIDDVSTPLLRHLMLFLIPSVAAVGVYTSLLLQHAAAFLLATVVITALTLVATAWTLDRLIKRVSQ